jgi:hypothetical protein
MEGFSPTSSFESAGRGDPARIVAATTRTMPGRVLLVSSLISLPYRVMRVARAAGTEVHVLGTERSRCLAHSRDCHGFTLIGVPITGEYDPGLAEEINRAIHGLGIDMVLPGDAEATRSLIAIRQALDAPCFPMPSLAQFDLLNNKWKFTGLARELGLLCPQSWLARDATELRELVEAGKIRLPAIAKPVNHDGSLGVLKLDPSGALAQIEKIDYAPIIVQEFIPGRDIGASIFCAHGEIKAFIAHELRHATYHTLDEPAIEIALARVAARLGLDGVFNFDMRLTSSGRIYYLECNPRFFFKMFQSMIAGVNFVAFGFGGDGPTTPPTGAAVRMPKALAAAALTTPWRITRRDIAMLRYFGSDPVSTLRAALGKDWERAGDAGQRHFTAPAMEAGGDRTLTA